MSDPKRKWTSMTGFTVFFKTYASLMTGVV